MSRPTARAPAGEQFAAFAKWYADTKAAGRTVGDIKPAVEDYGDAKAGAAATAEITFDTKQGDKSASQCLVFAWVEASPRKNTQAFSCDDVAAVEKWKTDQALEAPGASPPSPENSRTHRHGPAPGRPSWAIALGVEAHVVVRLVLGVNAVGMRVRKRIGRRDLDHDTGLAANI